MYMDLLHDSSCMVYVYVLPAANALWIAVVFIFIAENVYAHALYHVIIAVNENRFAELCVLLGVSMF